MRQKQLAVLTRVFYKKIYGGFCQAAKKSGRNNEVAVKRGSTVTNFIFSMLCVLASAWFPITSKVHDILLEFSLPIDSRINYRYLLS